MVADAVRRKVERLRAQIKRHNRLSGYAISTSIWATFLPQPAPTVGARQRLRQSAGTQVPGEKIRGSPCR